MNKIILSNQVIDNQLEGIQQVWQLDTEQEFNELYNDLYNDPDFIYLGQFDLVQDIDNELEYQGFTLQEIAQLTMNRYGNSLEVIQFNDVYNAFIGAY